MINAEKKKHETEVYDHEPSDLQHLSQFDGALVMMEITMDRREREQEPGESQTERGGTTLEI